MSGFTEANVDEVAEHCRDNLDLIAECLQACWDGGHQISIGDCGGWNEGDTQYLAGPGILVSFTIGDHGLVMVLPKSLPLPDWYADADESQEARLQTLVMEWSLNLFPESFVCDDYQLIRSDNVAASIVDMEPLDWAKRLTFPVKNESGDPSEMYLYWPLAKPPLPQADSADALIDELTSGGLGDGIAAALEGAGQPTGLGGGGAQRSQLDAGSLAAHVGKFRVNVSVRLAEKRVNMESLLALMPGSLITFEKPCEDMLDLFVNNIRFCKGEAVKIGEQFGLKVNEVGVEDEVVERVINV